MNTIIVSYLQSIITQNPCQKCNSLIDALDDAKFVRISIGSSVINFHEDCFEEFIHALLEFHRVFIEERQGEQKERVH